MIIFENLPCEDGIQSSDLPVWIRKQRDIEGEALVAPQLSATDLTRLRHVAQNGQRKFFQGPLGFDDLLEQRNDAVESGIFLSSLVQTAHVVNRVEDLVRNLAEVAPFHGGLEEFGEHIDGVGVLKRVQSRRQHGQVLNELQHGDLVDGRHSSKFFQDPYWRLSA